MSPRVVFHEVDGPGGRWGLVARVAEEVYRGGGKVLIHCANEEAAGQLDQYLWSYRDDSFLPHQVAGPGGLLDPAVPVLLVTGEENPTGATTLIQDAPCSPGFANGFGVVVDFVERDSQINLQASRERFRAWREGGAEPEYVRG